MALMESSEMYLETIYILSKSRETVHAVDVCEYMHFSKPSVSNAVKHLKEGGYITVDKDRHIFLTDEGRKVAEEMYSRHTVLTRCLESLGVSSETAEKDACLIEHDLSTESFEAIKRAVERHGKEPFLMTE